MSLDISLRAVIERRFELALNRPRGNGMRTEFANKTFRTRRVYGLRPLAVPPLIRRAATLTYISGWTGNAASAERA
jgi:hypothetical protein